MLKSILLFLVMGPLSLNAFAKSYQISPSDSLVGFEIIKFKIGAPVTGKFSEYSGEVIKDERNHIEKVLVKIKSESINTEDEKRDNHLKSEDFFYSQKYPEIVFESKEKVKIGENFDLKGNLTMKGRSRPVVLNVKKVSDTEFSAETTINRLDYGVSWNKNMEESDWKTVLGVLGKTVLDDKVKINIKTKLVESK